MAMAAESGVPAADLGDALPNMNRAWRTENPGTGAGPALSAVHRELGLSATQSDQRRQQMLHDLHSRGGQLVRSVDQAQGEVTPEEMSALAALPLDLLRSVSRHRALISHGREKVGGWGVRYVDDARIRGAPEPRATVVKLHLQATSEARERRVTAEKLRADK